LTQKSENPAIGVLFQTKKRHEAVPNS
jgi:hypothetical protein